MIGRKGVNWPFLLVCMHTVYHMGMIIDMTVYTKGKVKMYRHMSH